MTIEEKTESYKSHKYKRNVYVELDSKTKLGKDLLKQYHEQTKYHCMDIGRIGYHNEYGKYIIDNYTVRELLVVPKLIIRVTERAMDRAGRDVYQLRTYMSKFGQLNFLLIVDSNYADLILVENIYIENMNHRENYETKLWRLNYYNKKPLPLGEIFYKYGIKANPDDYGKSWKEDVKINNIVVATAKATFGIKLANQVASLVNQKVLVTSLNALNSNGKYGENITKEYSKIVSKKKEVTALTESPKLENTLNNVLIKTIEEKTSKKDLTNKKNFDTYQNVLNFQFNEPKIINEEVEKLNTKNNFKIFLADIYQNKNNKDFFDTLEMDKNQANFEKIINFNFDKSAFSEEFDSSEEKLNSFQNENYLKREYKNFENQVVDVDLDLSRFERVETRKNKRLRIKKEKQEAKENKAKKKKNIIEKELLCDLDAEYERQKNNVKEYEKQKEVSKLLKKDEKQTKDKIKEDKNQKENKKIENKNTLISKLEKKIKKNNQASEKRDNRRKLKSEAKQKRVEERSKEKEKKLEQRKEKNKLKEQIKHDKLVTKNNQKDMKQKKKQGEHLVFVNEKKQEKKQDFRPVLKPAEKVEKSTKEDIMSHLSKQMKEKTDSQKSFHKSSGFENRPDFENKTFKAEKNIFKNVELSKQEKKNNHERSMEM